MGDPYNGVYGSDSTGENLPSEGDVRQGVEYGTDDVGTLVVPNQNQVANGIRYGTDGTELTGIHPGPYPAGDDTGWLR